MLPLLSVLVLSSVVFVVLITGLATVLEFVVAVLLVVLTKVIGSGVGSVHCSFLSSVSVLINVPLIPVGTPLIFFSHQTFCE